MLMVDKLLAKRRKKYSRLDKGIKRVLEVGYYSLFNFLCLSINQEKMYRQSNLALWSGFLNALMLILEIMAKD